MQRSLERILTTHVGSLPRTEELKQLMFAREDGLPFDPSALDEQVARAVELVVDRQLKTGLDIVNDGEMPKPSYRGASIARRPPAMHRSACATSTHRSRMRNACGARSGDARLPVCF